MDGISRAVLLLSQILIATAGNSAQTLSLRHNSIFWGPGKAIPFAGIQTIHVDTHTSTGKEANNSSGVSYSCRVEVVPHNGAPIPLRMFYSGNFLARQQQIHPLSDFLSLPAPLIRGRQTKTRFIF